LISQLAVIAAILVAAWLVDRWRRRRIWGRKSAEELLAILRAADWRYWQLALVELQRRRHAIVPAVAALARHLLDGTRMQRIAARMALMKACAETRPYLQDYRTSEEEPARRQALQPLLAKYKAS
jgi:flagellar biogenesis protein FliO